LLSPPKRIKEHFDSAPPLVKLFAFMNLSFKENFDFDRGLI